MHRQDEDNLRLNPTDGETNAPSGAGVPRSSASRQRSRYWTDAVQRLRPLSISEAALAARCHRSEIERRIEQGDLPVIQRLSCRYIRQEDLQQMLENEAQVSPESGRHRPGGNGRRRKMDQGEIDPRLREFFD